MKRNNKIDYYHKYYETNKNNASSIWKGIRSIVNISKSPRKDIKLFNDNRNTVCDPKTIVDLFHKYFVNLGLNVDSKIPKAFQRFQRLYGKHKGKQNILLNSCDTTGII